MHEKESSLIKRLIATLRDWFPVLHVLRIAPAPTRSTSIKCENCGLVNPSVWERCERCNAPLGTETPVLNEAESPAEPLPDLIKKV